MLLLAQSTFLTNIISFLMVFLFGLVAWRVFVKSNGTKSVDAYFTENATHKLKTLALMSTFTECIGLAFLAILRDVDVFNAVARFGMMCFFELLCTYMFINTSNGIQKFIIDRVFEDDELHWKEIGWVVPYLIAIVPLFIFFTIPTWFIAQLYYESTGALRLVFNTVSPYPWEQVQIYETGEKAFVELGALIIVWITPFISLFQIVATPIFEISARYKTLNEELYDDEDDVEYDDDEDDDDEDEYVPGEKLLGLTYDLSQITNHSEESFKKRIKEVLGISGDDTKTNPDIRTGSVPVEEYENDLFDMLMGDKDPQNPDGILGYYFVKSEYSKLNSGRKADVINELDELSNKLREPSITSTEKEELQDKIDILEVEKTELNNKAIAIKNKMKDIVKQLEDTCRMCSIYP